MPVHLAFISGNLRRRRPVTAFFLTSRMQPAANTRGHLAPHHDEPAGARGRNVAAKTRFATGIDQALADDLIH
jgi:hypothetical protein